jgi:hypothetical protein
MSEVRAPPRLLPGASPAANPSTFPCPHGDNLSTPTHPLPLPRLLARHPLEGGLELSYDGSPGADSPELRLDGACKGSTGGDKTRPAGREAAPVSYKAALLR